MNRGIWWIRRDLRLIDNQALASALEASGQVIPVFILDSRLLTSSYASQKRTAFLLACLGELDANLRRRGSYLVVRQGNALQELTRLLEESVAHDIYAEPDETPYARCRDRLVSENLPIHWSGSPAVHPPGTVTKRNGAPYTLFTPFSKAWKALPLPQPGAPYRAPSYIPTPTGIVSLSIPFETGLPSSTPFTPVESEAQRRLERFTQSPAEGLQPPIYCYAADRDRLDLDGTSQLSPYLRFGLLSARLAVSTALQAIQDAPDAEARQGAETWLNELIWREYYIHLLYHYPQARQGNFRAMNVRWENDPERFTAWCTGLTGYPVIDAAMRQMAECGWMHNRARMLVASFLTKDLLVDWRWGERWFMQHLIDGDPAANNGGWQWSAGTGADAAPYFRFLNPSLQGIKYDPQGAYIHRWLPELSQLPDEYIHEPWTMPLDVQRASQCVIGVDYPAPIVDHPQAKEQALKAYRRLSH